MGAHRAFARGESDTLFEFSRPFGCAGQGRRDTRPIRTSAGGLTQSDSASIRTLRSASAVRTTVAQGRPRQHELDGLQTVSLHRPGRRGPHAPPPGKSTALGLPVLAAWAACAQHAGTAENEGYAGEFDGALVLASPVHSAGLRPTVRGSLTPRSHLRLSAA